MSGVFSGDRLVLCPLAVAFLPSRSSRALAPLSLQPSHNIVLQLCVDAYNNGQPCCTDRCNNAPHPTCLHAVDENESACSSADWRSLPLEARELYVAFPAISITLQAGSCLEGRRV